VDSQLGAFCRSELVDRGRAHYQSEIAELDRLEITDEGRKLVDSVKEVVGATWGTNNQAMKLASSGKSDARSCPHGLYLQLSTDPPSMLLTAMGAGGAAAYFRMPRR